MADLDLIPDDIFDPSIKLPAGKPQVPPPDSGPFPRLTARKVQQNLKALGQEFFRLANRYEVTQGVATRADLTAARAEALARLGRSLVDSLEKCMKYDDAQETKTRRAIEGALLSCVESVYEALNDIRARIVILEQACGLEPGAGPPELIGEEEGREQQ